MAKARIYELMFIIRTDLAQEKRDELVEKVKGWVTERVGGTFDSFTRWGIRKLAFRTQLNLTDGDYSWCIFRADPDKVNELSGLMNVTPEIFRYQFFRREDLEKNEKKKTQNITVEEPVKVENSEQTPIGE
ncbi:MAG TPA: 30S ribosomal protein S6 [Petrotogaceae bacterium]|jgi:small subunit ribosomal protein S6|nr:30S ribosomal protein S6 [Petrotogaceae bacterium]HPX15710.1 30S ribosomal protein S6 [Petrotogaceae bacterium]HQC39750.1 30S ribosomal protein S6 [Petrotogaceae bacterium]